MRDEDPDHLVDVVPKGVKYVLCMFSPASLRDSRVSNSRYVLLLRTSDIAGAEAGIEIEGTSESLRRCRNACRARNYARTSIQNAS